MNLKYLDRKDPAQAMGLILLVNTIFYTGKYYQYRYMSISPLIPEEVMIQMSRPYLVGAIVAIIALGITWTLYYHLKYRMVMVIGIITLIFNFINRNIIGESWSF